MKLSILAALLLTFAAPLPSLANEAHHKVAAATEQARAPLTEGEVRKIDLEAKKITIRHGPIKNLDMPAMTMVFQVKDPALLEQVKTGDKVRFEAEKIGGQFTVMRIEPAN
jgi:Cu/Ag efflux protein CusF